MAQGSVEGGFMGRTNKLVDGCYSYWVGALFPLLATLQQHPHGTYPHQQPTQQAVPTGEPASQTGKLSCQTEDQPVPTAQTIPVREADPTDRSFGGCEGPVIGGPNQVAAASMAGERVTIPRLPQSIGDASERLRRDVRQHQPTFRAPEVMPRPMWLLS